MPALNRRRPANHRRNRRQLVERLESRNLLAVVTGEVFLDINGDGDQGRSESGAADVRVYVDADDNGVFDPGELSAVTNANGVYQIDDVPVGDVILRIAPSEGQIQSSPQGVFATGFIDRAAGDFSPPSDFYEISSDGSIRNIGTTPGFSINGAARTNDGRLIGLDIVLGTFVSIDPFTGTTTKLADVQDATLGFGLAQDPLTDTVYAVGTSTTNNVGLQLFVVDPDTGELSEPVSAGLDLQGGSAPAVSDLAFDWVERRVVGYENGTDTFFEFPIGGTPQLLASARRALNSFSLGFDGASFFMNEQGAAGDHSDAFVEVDPETGSIRSGFRVGNQLTTESLIYTHRGDVAVRQSISFDFQIVTADFGVTSVPADPIAADHPSVINELLVEPFGGNDDRDQMVEFRGLPGGSLGDNTYFVIVDEDNENAGEIHGIFDLSNQAFGENGFLVLLPQNSPFQPHPLARVLRSDAPGFGGLPGGIYTDSHPLSDRIDFILGPNTYMLIQTDTPPALGDDIDVDDDGLADPDGLLVTWNVLDSISLHPQTFSDDQAYGQILIAEVNGINDPLSRTVPEGATILLSDGFGYAARIGDSIGSGAGDWMSGEPVPVSGVDPTIAGYEVNGDGFDYPEPLAYHSRDLDHVGDSNFVGGVRGTITVDPARDSEVDDLGNPVPSQPAAGVTVLADTNANGQRDVLTFTVDPDQAIDRNSSVLADDQVLTNAFEGVTISTTVGTLDNEPFDNNIQSRAESTSVFGSNNRVFSDGSIDSFWQARKLRFDFYQPVHNASIDAIGSGNNFFRVFARLEAYDANDQLISSALSRSLAGSARQRLTVDSGGQENIAYVLAYADTSIPGGTSLGRFDRLQYRQSEAIATTDDQGRYEIRPLRSGSYSVAVLQGGQFGDLQGGLSDPFQITRRENYVISESFRPNSLPVVAPTIEFLVAEDLPAGSSIGSVVATELDGQSVTFEIVGGDSDLLVIDPLSGQLSVADGAVLDFERDPELTVAVSVSDPIGSSATNVTVKLSDVNESPVVQSNPIFVVEGSPSGTALGQINAVDPDASGSGVFFEVLGGSGQGLFAVDPSNGLVTLMDAAGINFDAASLLTLDMRVSDNSVPPLTTDFQQVIEVIDQNDPPSIVNTQLTIAENSVGSVAKLEVNDRDLGQNHAFRLIGGSGSGVFDVLPDGSIVVRDGATVDFETRASYEMDVLVIDSGAPPLATQSRITLTIADQNEAPTITQTNVTIAEDAAPGSLVTPLETIDPEGYMGALTITLLDAEDGGEFAYDPQTRELTVGSLAQLDFEVDPVKSIRLRISDPAGVEPTSDVRMTISLTDANDPPIIETGSIVLSELTQPGELVGPIRVTDRDFGESLTGTILGGNAAALFEFEPGAFESGALHLRVAEGATFDADVVADPLVLEVQVTDSQGSSATKSISVLVNNVNESPIINSSFPVTNQVISGERFEQQLPADAVTDPEGGPFQLTVYDPQTGQLPGWLKFDPTTRILTGLAIPQVVGNYELRFRAFERGPLGLQDDESFSITVDGGDTPLTNKRNPLDVDSSGTVTALDALRVINYVRRHGSEISFDPDRVFNGFVDTNADGQVTNADALLIINNFESSSSVASLPEAESITPVRDDSDDVADQALSAYLDEPNLF